MSALHEYKYDNGTVAYIITCTALVFFMVPGLGFLYSGLARRKSALSQIWSVLMAGIVGMVQWYFWGYSLAFSGTASNPFIGNMDSFGFRNVYGSADADYPEFVFAIFQMMFLCVTLAIIAGAVAERGRLLPHMVFLFFWATLVYCPIVSWVWRANGWAAKWGVLDYAGGLIEVLTGFTGFVYSAFLGKRKERLLINFRPHNVSLVTLGTMILWFGWLGFNGGTALYPGLKAMYAIMNTNLCACFAAMTWCLLDYRLERKWSTVGMCSGIISGLVAATPSSGNITLYGSVILGIVTGIVCNFATGLKYLVHVDDAMDILAEHGIAGVLGLLFNAFFGADWVIGMDGVTEHPGGFISHNYKQIYKQIAWIAVLIGWTVVVSSIICFVVDHIPGLYLRASEEGEAAGMDEDQIGEFAYDYVEVRRDFLSWGNGQEDYIPPVENQIENENIDNAIVQDTVPATGDESTQESTTVEKQQ
ncbi:CYFA0S27e00562g1_1 [Cyberlindnera fabianii]|uniref:Ammonium transporter n=1 Tax=Cyberlindnera fabianii TaxID=36022 RepID=A0A061BGG5_CYBFA|nr:CYFA0S27e00562g1_1 [Cyberlindnera fabianii]